MKYRGLAVAAVVVAVVSLCFAAVQVTAVDNDGDKEDADTRITVQDLPEAVRATLERELGSGKIESLEKETEDGKTVYSADVIKADGKLYDIEIAEDGKLIKCELEDANGCEKGGAAHEEEDHHKRCGAAHEEKEHHEGCEGAHEEDENHEEGDDD